MIETLTLLVGLTAGAGMAAPHPMAGPVPSAMMPGTAAQSAPQGFCTTPRVRKDVKDLSAEEKQKLVAAIHALKATPSPYDPRYTYYDQFVRWHQLAVVVSKEHGGAGIAHHNPAFPLAGAYRKGRSRDRRGASRATLAVVIRPAVLAPDRAAWRAAPAARRRACPPRP